MGDETRPKILVVDDNADNRALAEATLADEGYDVVLAADGEEGVAAFAEHAPECVLLDIRMPKLDGFEACARIRALPGGRDTPVVFLTALRDVDAFDRAIRAGGDDFVTKPVRPTELVLRVQAALTLRRMSAELRQNYEIVRKQRDDLMRLQLQKERLIGFVVHDLKNPVTTLGLLAELLSRSRELPASAQDLVRQMLDETRDMMRLILNLLDINRSEEGQLAARPEQVDLQALTGRILDALGVRARARQLQLTSAVNAKTVRADPDLLRRVLENLLENAIRHAPESSEVVVAADFVDGVLEMRVVDAGPGIPAELREKIFERYAQAEMRDASRTGRGLGLTFCRLAVEAHGGRIWVDEAAPSTTFRIRIPQ